MPSFLRNLIPFRKSRTSREVASKTVWMAYSTAPAKAGQVRMITLNQETMKYSEIFFGGFSLLVLFLAIAGWAEGEVSLRSPVVVFIFVAVQILLTRLTMRSMRVIRFQILHHLIGGIICPVAYLMVDGAMAPWWAGYAIASLSGVVTLGLMTERPLWGPLLVGYYFLNLTLATWLGIKDPNWYKFAQYAGGIAMVGLMFAEVMALLGKSLSRIHERTVKLRRAKDELQEMEHLKTDFFSNMSHEFRTPITLTLGPLEGILKGRYGEVSEGVRTQAEIMLRNQQRLLGLINQILDVAKVEAGAVQLKAARMKDLNKFVKERTEQFRSMAEEKGIRLKVSLDPLLTGIDLYIDREKFDKILFNLLSNAFKFTRQGSIEVATEIQGNSFFLKVSDTGIGIREDQLPNVFRRFRQAEGSVSREQMGTGLGLALVRELAKLHGGDVSVQSEYGKGTIFEVVIPVGKGHLNPKSIVDFDEEEMPQAVPQPTPAPEGEEDLRGTEEMNAEAETSRDSSRPTVLYVDDNQDLRYYVRDLLLTDYNVFLAVQGEDGLSKARQYKPDLILSDVMMPVMTGTELCKKIREDPLLKAIPFVLLTARSMLDAKIEGLEKGADDYLTKPFSESELLARVRNLITLRQEQVKLKRELAAARAIQLSLLPPLQQRFDGVAMDLLYHPSEELSGDFCDVILQGEWLYLYLADVTSHGTASAQVTYLLKEIFHQAIRANGAREAPSLQDLIGTAGRQYAAHRLEYDVGIQLARFHVKRRILEYIRGNAPPPIRVSRTGASGMLSVKPGPAISGEGGRDLSFPFSSLELESGDVVYFFTDGCIEFPVKNKQFGLKRLSALLSAQGSEEWQKSAFDSLVQENGGPVFPDDLTILRLAVGPLTS